MKLIIVFTIIACMHTSAKGFSQTISLSLKNAPLEKVLQEIEKQTSYFFVYTKEVIQKTTPVTIHLQNVPVRTVLEQCFRDQPLSYNIDGDHIVIHKKAVAERIIIYHNLKGKITNAEGLALGGVTVTVKGTAKATVTNINGEFTLEGIEPDAILSISSAEMEVKEVRVNGRDFISVSLSQKVNELDETIVIGYGTTTRRYATGSVSKITAADISKQPIANPLAALQGRVPGLVVTSTSGLPGSAFTVQIRGQNTINPNPGTLNPFDQPLFIIDGVPFTTQNGKISSFSSLASPDAALYNNPHGSISPFSSINPADIESMEILRDADATAIYGSRGANGVILITTKKGKAGATSLHVNISRGASVVTRSVPMMDVHQYRAMRYEAFYNDGLIPSASPGSTFAPDLFTFDSTRNVDWKKYFIGGTANTTDINTRLSGGSANTQFSFSSGYHHETYIFPGDFGYKRASFSASMHHNSADRKFIFDFSTNYSYDQNNSAGAPNALQAFSLPPNYPAFLDDNGNLNWNYRGVNLSGNPMGYLKQKSKFTSNNLISKVQLGYELTKGLFLKSSFGYNTFRNDENSQSPKSSQSPTNFPIARSSFATNNFRTIIIEPQINYTRAIEKGKLDVLIGGTYQMDNVNSSEVQGVGYPDDDLLGSVSGAKTIYAEDNFSEYKYVAVFGRINYVCDRKYILNITGRRDGSSRFGPGKQFGNFGSVGTGWLFSEEAFIKKYLSAISFGKIRLSYGTTGSDKIGDYGYISRWAPGQEQSFQGSTGYFPQNLFTSGFSWSVTKKTEAALELGFLKDRILFSAAWYRNRCGNQLVSYQLPSQTGFAGVTANFPAIIQNTGWEFTLTSNNIKNKQLTWTSSLNLSIGRNKLVSFPGFETSPYRFSYQVGQSTSALKTFIFSGVNPATGIYEFKTKGGTPGSEPLTGTDREIIGNRDPKYYGGLNNSLTFGSFQFDIFLEFKKQMGANYFQQIYANHPAGTRFANLPVAFANNWKKPGDQTDIAKFTSQRYATPAGLATINYAMSDAAYSDASYIRFKTVSLSYSINKKFIQKIKAENCRVYVNAQNLFTITNYKGHDPETIDFYGLPPLRTIVAGIQFTF